jgi:3-hydroxyisobutyrate dehydrogenase
MTVRVGFIGLGNIGQPIAARIVGAGLATTVYDRRPDACRPLAARGARVAPSLAAVAAGADVIGVCVRDDDEVTAVVAGADGLLAAVTPGTVLALHSTITPHTVRRLGGAAAARGVALLDAPITGGAAAAANGTLTYMVGGDAAPLARARPVFATSAARIIHTGALGSGAATKLCNNLMLYMELLAAREAAALARRSGVELETLIEVTRAAGIMSDAMASIIRFAEQFTAAPYDAGLLARARHFAALAEKDLAVALASADAAGLTLPGAAAARALMPYTYGRAGAPER